jgi:hypothetical protein
MTTREQVISAQRDFDEAMIQGDTRSAKAAVLRRRALLGGVVQRGAAGGVKTSLQRDMERISAECRALASQADQARIQAVTAPRTQRRVTPRLDPRCVDDWDELELEIDGFI